MMWESPLARIESLGEEKLIEELRKLLIIEDGKPKWNDELAPKAGPYQDHFHSPLYQFWVLFFNGGGVNFPKAETYRALLSPKTIEIDDNIDYQLSKAQLFDCEGYSGDILDSISQIEFNEGSKFQEELKHKIKSAKKIMLAGCLHVFSATVLIKRLQELGFHGELDIYDLSAVPLAMIEVYKRVGFWEGDITIKTFQKDLFGESLGEEGIFGNKEEDRGFDLIINDVLLYYVSNDDAQKQRFTEALNEGGYLLLREMMEIERSLGKEQILTKKEDYDDREKAIGEFVKWVFNNFGIVTSEDEVKAMLDNIFSIPLPHDGRYPYLIQWLYNLFLNRGMKLVFRQLTTPAFQPGKRIFPIIVFKKGNFEQKNPIINALGTAICYE